jgi:hypothetical protein
MNPLLFMSVGDGSVLLFWLQMVVLIVGVMWCVALASVLFFGGWYAHTHPRTGNDQMIRLLTRLLWFLTFGLTDAPFPDLKSEGTSREVQGGPDAPVHLLDRHPPTSR